MTAGVYPGAGSCLVTLRYLPETHWGMPTGKHFPILSGIWWYRPLSRCVHCWRLVPCGRYHCSQRVHFYLGNQYDYGGWFFSVLFTKVFLPLWYLINQLEIHMDSWGDWYSPVPIFTGFQDLSENFWADYFLTFFILQQPVMELKCEQFVRSER